MAETLLIILLSVFACALVALPIIISLRERLLRTEIEFQRKLAKAEERHRFDEESWRLRLERQQKTLERMGVVGDELVPITASNRTRYDLMVTIDEAFNGDHIKTMFFYFDFDYDNFPGTIKRLKIQALIEEIERQRRMSELLHYLRKERPKYDWPKRW